MLAVCAGGLRHLLLSRGEELPDRDLRAQVPVNIRSEDRRHALGNELTSLFVELPIWAWPTRSRGTGAWSNAPRS